MKNLGKPSKDEAISAVIKIILDKSTYNNYGVPRMKLVLEQQGIKVGTRRLSRIMRENGWIHERNRKAHGLTKATTEAQEKENLIKQRVTAPRPLTLLLTDLSQIQCYGGKLYILPILDCFNGEIVSLQMRSNMKKELCIDTVRALRGGTSRMERSSILTVEASTPAMYSRISLAATVWSKAYQALIIVMITPTRRASSQHLRRSCCIAFPPTG